jgi:hypothetical protein
MIKIKCLARKFLLVKFFLQPLFQSARHFFEKREGSGRPKNMVGTEPKDPDPDADPEHWSLDEETGVRIPDGELSSRVVRQLLNLGGQEGVDHKHQRFRVPT